MQRPARPFRLRLCVPLAMALVAGCVTVEDQPELTTAEAACGACASPPLVDWVRGGPGADELFPRDVQHLNVLFLPSDDRSFLAFGTGGGEALWLYRVPMGESSNLLAAIASAAEANAEAGLLAFFSVQGHRKGPPPPPPHPIGDPPFVPPFSPEFVNVVVESGIENEQQTQQVFEQLSGL
jgi:hypothetical protein